MNQSAPRLHFLDSKMSGQISIAENRSSLEQISRFRILQIRAGASWSKNGKNAIWLIIQICGKVLAKQTSLSSGWARGGIFSWVVVNDRSSLILSGIF